MSASSLATVPLLPCALSADVVQFVSVQRALFSAPPSAELADYQQRLKQLPEAIRRNRATMTAAKQSETAELTEIGGLTLEYDRLRKELAKLRTEVPDNSDVLEVRDTMQLPIGLAQLEGQLYFIQRPAAMQPQNRRVAAVQLHTDARFKHPPYDAALAEGTGALFQGSAILRLEHVPSMLRLFGGERPSLRLLWRGSEHEFSAESFHRLCDGKGPTLTVVRSAAVSARGDQSYSSQRSAAKSHIFGAFGSASFEPKVISDSSSSSHCQRLQA